MLPSLSALAKAVACSAALAWILSGLSSEAADLRLGPVAPSRPQLPCYELLELTFPLQAAVDNPFDPRQIAVDGLFRAPDGRECRVPGFLFREYRRRLQGQQEVIEPSGNPVWKVRFAPNAPGRWSVQIQVQGTVGQALSSRQEFSATPARGPGYIRRSADPRYFRYDDGTPFFGIGENIAWSNSRGTFAFDEWLRAAADARMNLVRIWLQWNRILSIEHKATGAGRYDLGNAWRMDHVLDEARRLGVRVLFCCDSPEPYQKVHVYEAHRSYPWKECPHNAANGGPLKEPEEFYTTQEGHRLIRQRLRYIVARWGWDPNIFCWELWNEMSCFPDWQKWMPQTVEWHREMAALLRELDVNRHLVTTSFGSCSFAKGTDDIWRMEELDFVQTHIYGSYGGGLRKMGQTLPAIQREMARRYHRPHVFGEFGCHVAFTGPRLDWDPAGLYLHNGLWASALSGSAATALTWYWDNFVHNKSQYRHFPPIARFCADVPWTAAGFRDAQATFQWQGNPPPPVWDDLVLDSESQWDIANNRFTVLRDGTLHGGNAISQYLHGSNHQKRRKPLVLEVDYPRSGKLVMRVNKVSVLGILEVRRDGEVVLRQELPAGPGDGPWKQSRIDGWNCWEAIYDRDFSIDVPAGKHEIRLDNLGKDAIVLASITLPAYVSDNRPALRCVGLVGPKLALLWIQNRDHEWERLHEGKPVCPVQNAQLVLENAPGGKCRVQWWDTWEGKITTVTDARAENGRLVLSLPPSQKDLACKVYW